MSMVDRKKGFWKTETFFNTKLVVGAKINQPLRYVITCTYNSVLYNLYNYILLKNMFNDF